MKHSPLKSSNFLPKIIRFPPTTTTNADEWSTVDKTQTRKHNFTVQFLHSKVIRVRSHPFMMSKKNQVFDPPPLPTCVHMGRTPPPIVDVYKPPSRRISRRPR